MSLHPGTDRYNPAGNSDFTRKAEALALGITNWSTPKATDGAKGGPGQSYGSGGMPPLPAQAAQWQIPVADDQMDRLRGKINSRGEPKLSAQALQWLTPAAQNWKGSSEASITRADGKSRMDILHYRAEQGFTRPDPAITAHGLQPSHHAPISRPLWASMIASGQDPLICLRLPSLRDSRPRANGGDDEQSLLADGRADGTAEAVFPEEPWQAQG
jgi:hypothetical protein